MPLLLSDSPSSPHISALPHHICLFSVACVPVSCRPKGGKEQKNKKGNQREKRKEPFSKIRTRLDWPACMRQCRSVFSYAEINSFLISSLSPHHHQTQGTLHQAAMGLHIQCYSTFTYFSPAKQSKLACSSDFVSFGSKLFGCMDSRKECTGVK